jgi:hypothetical protein
MRGVQRFSTPLFRRAYREFGSFVSRITGAGPHYQRSLTKAPGWVFPVNTGLCHLTGTMHVTKGVISCGTSAIQNGVVPIVTDIFHRLDDIEVTILSCLSWGAWAIKAIMLLSLCLMVLFALISCLAEWKWMRTKVLSKLFPIPDNNNPYERA